jgi:hypothetical protein
MAAAPFLRLVSGDSKVAGGSVLSICVSPVVDSADLSTKLAAVLDQLAAILPADTPDEARRRHVAANARFAGDLVPPTIAAAQHFEPLAEKNLFNVAAATRALQDNDTLRPMHLRLQALTDSLGFLIDSGLADAGADCLHTYKWSQRRVKQPGGDGLRPYVAEMQRVVEKILNRRPKRPTPATPAPQGFLPTAPNDPADELLAIMESDSEE